MSVVVILLAAVRLSAQYCIPDYITGTIEGDYLDVFQLGDIYNASGPGDDYNDFTAMSTDLTIGSTNSASITNTPTYPENYQMWIDYNQDEVFESDESCGTISLAISATGNITFTVPLTATLGPTRLRIRCIYDVGPWDPCDTFSYGETEDYTVNIVAGEPNDVGVSAITSPVSGTTLGTESITVTIQNYGSEEASAFNMHYEVDGGTIVTEPFLGSIPAYSTASFTFATTYDFSAINCYDISAWTEWESDTNIGNDSTEHTICHVGPITGTGSWYIYSNLDGGAEPWFTTVNSDEMTAVFGPEGTGWTRAYFETVDPDLVFNSDNCFVFLEGSDFCADALEAFLNTNITLIENWVSSGGKLLLNAAPNVGDGMSFGFDGTTLNYPLFTSNATAVDAGHPIFNGPYLPAGTDYSGGSFAHAFITGTGLTSVMINSDDLTSVVLAEKDWGDGHVMFGGMTTTNFHSPAPNAANLRQNIFSYLGCTAVDVCNPPDGLYADGITGYGATLHWNAVAGADQYVVSLWNLSTGAINKKHINSGTSVTLDGGMTPSTTYGFRVKTVCYYDLADISPYTDFYYFTTGPGRYGDFGTSVVLYPNPGNGNFNLAINGYADNTFNLSVYDPLGQEVYSSVIQVTTPDEVEHIQLSNLPAGVYQVALTNGESQMNYPLVITK